MLHLDQSETLRRTKDKSNIRPVCFHVLLNVLQIGNVKVLDRFQECVKIY